MTEEEAVEIVVLLGRLVQSSRDPNAKVWANGIRAIFDAQVRRAVALGLRPITLADWPGEGS